MNIQHIPHHAQHSTCLQRLSIFGLGYVGSVSSACFADLGHRVIGVDPDTRKTDIIALGQSPIVEDGLSDVIHRTTKAGRLSTTQDVAAAVLNSDISLVCVGTPSTSEGACDLKYLEAVSQQIGEALRNKSEYHVIAFRSTVPPGTTRNRLLPIIEEASGKTAGPDFGIGFHPEFLRESTAIEDFFAPPKTVIGALDEQATEALCRVYDTFDDTVIRTTIEAAESVKYVDNTWHALKVSFANEVGKVCKANGIDSHEVMDIFCQDTKLNISSYYMKPGFAFGGSCLPKDVRGFCHLANSLGVATPVISSILNSNTSQIEFACDLIRKTGGHRIAFLGLTFKSGTDDLRESPILAVINKMVLEGHSLKIYDPNCGQDMLDNIKLPRFGHNGHYRADTLAHVSMQSVGAAVTDADVIVISHDDPAFREAALTRRDDQHVVDLVRVFGGLEMETRLKQTGILHYLQKPVSRAVMNSKLDQLCPERSDVLKVLVVEDNPAVAEVVKAMLLASGHVPFLAPDGRQAVNMAALKKFDVILMDIAMPHMDGLEATQVIRDSKGMNAWTPIVAMTAYAQPETSDTYTGVCW